MERKIHYDVPLIDTFDGQFFSDFKNKIFNQQTLTSLILIAVNHYRLLLLMLACTKPRN